MLRRIFKCIFDFRHYLPRQLNPDSSEEPFDRNTPKLIALNHGVKVEAALQGTDLNIGRDGSKRFGYRCDDYETGGGSVVAVRGYNQTRTTKALLLMPAHGIQIG